MAAIRFRILAVFMLEMMWNPAYIAPHLDPRPSSDAAERSSVLTRT
jgi:hypothetical protein